MNKFVSLAALVAACSAMAGTAGAADLRTFNSDAVHISLAGKSSDQLKVEIKAAANQVCGASDAICVDQAIEDAYAQLSAIHRSSHPVARIDVNANGDAVMRVAVKGRSEAAVSADIRKAARAVCEATNADPASFHACMSASLKDAMSQLHTVAKAGGFTELASN
jgi:hypothetical protein